MSRESAEAVRKQGTSRKAAGRGWEWGYTYGYERSYNGLWLFGYGERCLGNEDEERGKCREQGFDGWGADERLQAVWVLFAGAGVQGDAENHLLWRR